jgi:hypothetical protein
VHGQRCLAHTGRARDRGHNYHAWPLDSGRELSIHIVEFGLPADKVADVSRKLTRYEDARRDCRYDRVRAERGDYACGRLDDSGHVCEEP